MTKYIPMTVEKKWQKVWKENGQQKIDLLKPGRKYYLLVEFPYSSGDLHIGHWFAFGVTDIFGRFKKMQGYDVFFPIGFDSFGLPAENAAIRRKLHPRDWTLKNIQTMTRQFHLIGGIHDWDHVIVTCFPEYYKWNQWIFLKMLEKGIAYRGKSLSNWCPVDQTVLADEQVINGKCDRCGADVTLKEVSQWFLAITKYANRLLWKGDEKVDWPKAVREGQNNWIGRSEGVLINFALKGKDLQIKVFTTRQDTLYGATFLVLAPEHPLVADITEKGQLKQVKEYQKMAAGKSQVERKEMREKTGVFTGAYATNPVNGEEIPIWTSDYALMGYGTGALFGDAHDQRDVEFAKKYKIALKPTLITGDKDRDKRILNLEEVFTGEGLLVDSGEFSGMTSAQAKKAIVKKLEKENSGQAQVQYHLHDWSISRQRYWGTPIPIINCPKCGVVPVPEKDLPVELPYEGVDYTTLKGQPPLATNKKWMKVKCPNCRGDAQREPETMDGFFDNSWYFYRYLSPNDQEQIFDGNLLKKWLPVDVYFGGAEHTLGHTMYSRFFTKFFKDIGLVDFDEYAKRRINHGVILGTDTRRMSKSRGNFVNPDEEVKRYGADAIRTYLAFIGPYDLVAPWDPGGIRGVYHFLERVWKLADSVEKTAKLSVEDTYWINKTIKKVGEDIENIKFNTAVAALMEWLNHLSRKAHSGKISQAEFKTLLLLLAPFAPHLTEELWQMAGEKRSIHDQPWPKYDAKLATAKKITLVVQINGKVRDKLLVEAGISEEDAQKLAIESEKVQKFLGGKSPRKVVYVADRLLNLVV